MRSRIGRQRSGYEVAAMRRILKSFRDTNGRPAGLALAGAFAACLFLAGCHQDMWNQPYYRTFNKAEDGKSSARKPVEGTVAYQGARREWTSPVFTELTGDRQVPPVTDRTFWTGRDEDGEFLGDNYFNVTPALLARGRERYMITCATCHGMAGHGDGLVTQRGMTVPATYHQDRLREVEDGYFFDVVSIGFGRMYSYASRVAPEDRWAIAAYIRALQFSQNVDITDENSEFARMVQDGIRAQEEAAPKTEEAAAADYQ